MITRLGACTPKHFGLHGESALPAKDTDGHEHYATASIMSGKLEALLDHALLCHMSVAADSAHGRAGALIFVPTQGHMTTACLAQANAPFPGITAARKLFALGTSVRDKLAGSKVKVGDAKRVPPASRLPADLMPVACLRCHWPAELLAGAAAGRRRSAQWVALGACLNHELVKHTVPAKRCLREGELDMAQGKGAADRRIWAACQRGARKRCCRSAHLGCLPTRRKEKVLQIGAFGLLANEAHASVLTAPLLEAPLLEAPTYDPLDLEHTLTVRNLAQNNAFLDADEDVFVGVCDGAGRRRRSCGP